ncbi:putative reverse transcriptase domain-containing protein [Tanacetum coccineum]
MCSDGYDGHEKKPPSKHVFRPVRTVCGVSDWYHRRARSGQLHYCYFILIHRIEIWDHRPLGVILFGDIPTGLDASDQAYSGSSTRDVSPRLESTSGDSSERPLHSSSRSAGPPHKRCRSLVDYVPSSTPHKENNRVDPIETEVDIKLGIGDEDDVRDHVEINPRDVMDDTEGYEADTSAGDTVEVGIDPMSALIVEEEIVETAGDDSSDSFGTRDGSVRSLDDMPVDLDEVVRDFYHHMFEVCIDRIVRIETVQRRLEDDQLIARGQGVSMIERIDSLRLENLKVHAMLDIERDRANNLRLHMSLSHEEFRQVRRDRDDTRGRLRRTMTITHSGLTLKAIDRTVNRRVEEALAAHEATRVANALETKNQSKNGSDGDNGNGRNGNGRNGNCRNENQYENGRGLIRWFKKIETVFHISNCPEKSQVNYATFTLLDSALTWWNSHKRTIGTEAAFAMSWRELMRLMTKVYCPRNKIQKMEIELWNLTMKNNDLTAYTQRFQELTMMCTKMVLGEKDRVEKFIGGLPDNI